MPVVNGCRKQDYAVLIVVGLPATLSGSTQGALTTRGPEGDTLTIDADSGFRIWSPT